VTFDSWPSGIRSGIAHLSDSDKWIVDLYFVSFTILVSIIMMNVVVAIMIEKYIDTVNQKAKQQNEQDLLFENSCTLLLLLKRVGQLAVQVRPSKAATPKVANYRPGATLHQAAP
jgi:phage shock protein PspC (stress-responsive transcriptional regulator)